MKVLINKSLITKIELYDKSINTNYQLYPHRTKWFGLVQVPKGFYHTCGYNGKQTLYSEEELCKDYLVIDNVVYNKPYLTIVMKNSYEDKKFETYDEMIDFVHKKIGGSKYIPL